MQIAGATLDMKPMSIKQRAARIRLPLKELAALAGVSEDNLHRVIRGNVDPRVSTVEKIEGALAAEEERLRRELGLAGDAA
jgi:predicted transcriptional regulator